MKKIVLLSFVFIFFHSHPSVSDPKIPPKIYPAKENESKRKLTPSDRGAESHSSIANIESQLKLASGIG